MKKQIRWKQVIGCLLFVLFTACTDTKEVLLPQDNSMLGLIGTRQMVAKTEQPLLLACPLRLSEHAKDVQVTWTGGEEEKTFPEDEQKDGVSYKTFVWNEWGKKEVECNVSYSYGDETKQLKQTMQVMVILPLFGKCFCGDSFERIKELYPDIELVDEEMERYIVRVSSSEAIYFEFMDNILYEITTVQMKSEAVTNPYHEFMNWVRNASVSEVDTEIKPFKCRPCRYDNISAEDLDFVFEVMGGKVLTDDDIVNLDRLLNEELIEFNIEVIHNYSSFCYQRAYELKKNDNAYYYKTSYEANYIVE